MSCPCWWRCYDASACGGRGTKHDLWLQVHNGMLPDGNSAGMMMGIL